MTEKGSVAMQGLRRQCLSVGTFLLVALGLVGCGNQSVLGASPSLHHHHRQRHPDPSQVEPSVSVAPKAPPVYIPKATSIPVQGAAFPAIMTMAMGHIHGLVASSAEAPTIIPWPKNGSTTLFYTPEVQGLGSHISGLIERYQVTLSSPPERVASFSSAVLASNQDATEYVEDLLIQRHLSYPLPGSQVMVGDGITATPGVEHGINLLSWTEGSWSIVVGRAGHLPLNTARDVADYLRTHFMPVPEPRGLGQGLIVVTQTSHGPDTNVAWQEGRWVYTTATYSTTQRPITTGLAMALSMRRYVK
jgi:hypothetical protein